MVAIDERIQRGTEGLDAGLQPFEKENMHQPGNSISGSEQVAVLLLVFRFFTYVVSDAIAGAPVLPELSLPIGQKGPPWRKPCPVDTPGSTVQVGGSERGAPLLLRSRRRVPRHPCGDDG